MPPGGAADGKIANLTVHLFPGTILILCARQSFVRRFFIATFFIIISATEWRRVSLRSFTLAKNTERTDQVSRTAMLRSGFFVVVVVVFAFTLHRNICILHISMSIEWRNTCAASSSAVYTSPWRASPRANAPNKETKIIRKKKTQSSTFIDNKYGPVSPKVPRPLRHPAFLQGDL